MTTWQSVLREHRDVQMALAVGAVLGAIAAHWLGRRRRRLAEGQERLWSDAFPALTIAKEGPIASTPRHGAAHDLPAARNRRRCLSTYRQRVGGRDTGMASFYHYLDESFDIPHDRLATILHRFQAELAKGLAKPGATVAMIPSYVAAIPDGTETGTYLAVDLGGTNFRVCQVTLLGNGKSTMHQRKFHLTDDVKRADGKALFDFIAEAVKSLLEDTAVRAGNTFLSLAAKETYYLGFTFSFPVDQTAIDRGVLLQWTKGFDSAGVVNEDVVSLLHDAFKRKGMRVKVTALVNDTVGTLMSHAYRDPETSIGVILGTGTNAAYIEHTAELKKLGPLAATASSDSIMIVNTEWGAFDNECMVLPLTKYDKQLDAASLFPGQQVFEKMISGMYLGELTRLVLLDFVEKKVLFAGVGKTALAEKFTKPNSFQTAYMSRIERDNTHALADIREILETEMMLGKYVTMEDCLLVKGTCQAVGSRAARLSAVGIAALILQRGDISRQTVAIDGSLFEHYPSFSSRMYDTLKEVFGLAADKITLSLASDGSGIGAALTAAKTAS